MGNPLVPVAYPFIFNGITIPLDYAMIYRVNVDSAFIDGIGFDGRSPKRRPTLIGKGGAWQLFKQRRRWGQWCRLKR